MIFFSADVDERENEVGKRICRSARKIKSMLFNFFFKIYPSKPYDFELGISDNHFG